MRIGSRLADHDPPLVRTDLGEADEAEARRILRAVSSACETSFHRRPDFPAARWNEWTVAAMHDGAPHRIIVIVHHDSLSPSGSVEDDGPESRMVVDVARRVLDAPVDHDTAAEAANALDTTLEAALMRRIVDPDLAEPFDVVWSGVTQLGPATLSAQTTFLDAVVCAADDRMPVGRIRIAVEAEDEFDRRMPTLRVSVDANLVRVDGIDAMERLRIEREAAIRTESRP